MTFFLSKTEKEKKRLLSAKEGKLWVFFFFLLGLPILLNRRIVNEKINVDFSH